jgi:hypothetical protein
MSLSFFVCPFILVDDASVAFRESPQNLLKPSLATSSSFSLVPQPVELGVKSQLEILSCYHFTVIV